MTLIHPWPPSIMRRTGPVWGFGRRGCSLLVAALGCTARDPHGRVGSPVGGWRGLIGRPRLGPEPRGLFFLWAA